MKRYAIVTIHTKKNEKNDYANLLKNGKFSSRYDDIYETKNEAIKLAYRFAISPTKKVAVIEIELNKNGDLKINNFDLTISQGSSVNIITDKLPFQHISLLIESVKDYANVTNSKEKQEKANKLYEELKEIMNDFNKKFVENLLDPIKTHAQKVEFKNNLLDKIQEYEKDKSFEQHQSFFSNLIAKIGAAIKNLFSLKENISDVDRKPPSFLKTKGDKLLEKMASKLDEKIQDEPPAPPTFMAYKGNSFN